MFFNLFKPKQKLFKTTFVMKSGAVLVFRDVTKIKVITNTTTGAITKLEWLIPGDIQILDIQLDQIAAVIGQEED